MDKPPFKSDGPTSMATKSKNPKNAASDNRPPNKATYGIAGGSGNATSMSRSPGKGKGGKGWERPPNKAAFGLGMGQEPTRMSRNPK